MPAGKSYIPFVDSMHLHDPPRLRAAMRDDGYLFLRKVAPREQLLALRRAIVQICAAAGWCDDDGRWSGAGPFTEGEPEYMAVYRQVINHPLFIAWADQRAFLNVMRKILDGEVLAHRLRIGRVTFPNNVNQTTAAHQDFNYIRGTPETYTIWTPLGDCPIELGGLAVLRGSHRGGFIEHELFREKKYANLGLSDEKLPRGERLQWHAGDLEAGDVLIFHSHMVHKALPNLTTDRLRISTDNRYQRAGEEIADISTKSHYGM